jgi:ABC-type transporter Mla MlaB component
MSLLHPSGHYLQMATPRRTTIVCDVGALAEPHVGTVHLLARLQLAARRHGRDIRLRRAPEELRELIVFCGLDDVLRLEPGRQSEEREQGLGGEEEGELADPAV